MATGATSPTRVAVVGCGPWGQNQLRAFEGLPDCEVALAVDIDRDCRTRVASSYPQLPTEADYRHALDTYALDAVVIATPASTHHPLARAALLAGKHVLCEKPLCATTAEAEDLVWLAESRGLRLMVGHVFLFNPAIIQLKACLDAGELGRPIYLSAVRNNPGPVRSDVNVAFDLATHDIAIFNWLLGGTPEQISADGTAYLTPGHPDVVVMSLRYRGNVFASIQVSWIHPVKQRQITLVGSHKTGLWEESGAATTLTLHEVGAEQIRASASGGATPERPWDSCTYQTVGVQPLRLQAQEFLRSVRLGCATRCDGAAGVQVARVLDAAMRSFQTCPSIAI